ncbi:hypothetical protein HNQ53_001046 [Microbulbifer hydrolyticus]|uniref:Uncharacterized protein n=1 Tax=Microbulbifer hydrolyticus TaxID=48074 RepID=A0AA89PI20_9GAMM|nr:hypothetical protein [Microbulbifer hydrolyticus]
MANPEHVAMSPDDVIPMMQKGDEGFRSGKMQ